jgi:sulfide:quinone oxidoreductase
MLFQDRSAKVNHDHVLQAIDLDKCVATYKTPAGTAEQACDFINVVPLMRAHEVVCNSPLPWTEGLFARDGWVEVDRDNLRHKRYPNVCVGLVTTIVLTFSVMGWLSMRRQST